MTVEKVIWTALPNGVGDNGRLRISVHVAPRLRNDDGSGTERKLGEFKSFESWPDRVNGFRFVVQFQGGPSVKGIPETAADSILWKILFPSTTPVGPHVFQDHAKRNLHIFPVRPVLQFLKQAYSAAAAAGSDLPSIDNPVGPLAPFVPLSHIPIRITDSQSFYEELTRARQDDKSDGQVVFEPMADSSLPPADQEAQNKFFQAYRFYYRPGSQRPDFPQKHIEPPPKPHEFDFHQMLSSLADHPMLLRRLGIIIDLVVDVDPSQVPAQGIVRVMPEGELPESPPTCPGTRYDLTGRWFGARPANNFRMSRGILRLSPEVYDLFQIDVDGAAMQAVSFSTTLEAMKDPKRRSEATPDEAGLPALRSAGLALARFGRGEMLLEDLKHRRNQNAGIDGGQPVIFDAEDLVRGYRVDVFDAHAPGGSRWFSLHRRVVEHMVKTPGGVSALEPLKLTDEGYLKATTASSENKQHPTPSDDLYLHETIAGWEGWSLSAPRPGKRIVEPGEGDAPGGSISRHDPEQGNPFPLVSRVSVEGRTLPRLRVGHSYRMRARTVDLAGNSVPFSERELDPPEPHLTSEAQAYLRFEPVPSPVVLRRHLDTEGESLEHLVVRSNLGISPADYAELPAVKQALSDAGAPHGYAGDSQRHVAPPKASQQMAEQDGRFDAAFGGAPAQVTAALRVALREEGTFLDETIVDLTTGQKTVAQAPISLFPPGATLPPVRGAGLPNGAYAFYPDPNVILPYLPDPLAIGVSLTGYDFTGAEVFHRVANFPGSWPTLAPFRLRLSEGPLGAEFVANILEVRLPKSEVVWTRFSSVFADGRLEDLAIWQWVAAADKTDALKKTAIQGRHWMLTPFREVIFTHAVQQPLVVSDMTKVTSSRSLGNTFAVFRGPIVNHAKSTGRLDVYGEWTEDVDLITDDEPRMRAFGTEVPHRAQAFGFDINRSEDNAEVALHQSRHEFGDTKYRRIIYHSVATTRFREFLPRPLTDVPANIQRVESTTDAVGALKPGLEHNILSSARPAAPEVLYVLPTFRWERQDEGNHRTHVRRGNAVRVWLRRPWFSSGDGEQLGVILEPGVRLPRGWGRISALELTAKDLVRQPPQISLRPLRRLLGPLQPITSAERNAGLSASFLGLTSNVITNEVLNVVAALRPTPEEIKKMLRPYVTAWGLDPVWQSALPELPPTVADFPRHTGYAVGLTLEELPPTVTVVVAAHDVYFDRGRKLWYCDIEIDPGETYFPFVRLAVARYQAHSLTGAHLSRVVMADFIQLAPDRTAEVSLSESTALVKVKGFSGRNILANISPLPFLDINPNVTGGTTPNTTMRVALERRVPGVPGDLGWERVGGETTLAANASGFHVTWTGTVQLPPNALEGDGYRLLVTEVETYKRDLIPGDPMVSTSPLDFVRERVVYADTFEL
jgi:hypothetical protein